MGDGSGSGGGAFHNTCGGGGWCGVGANSRYFGAIGEDIGGRVRRANGDNQRAPGKHRRVGASAPENRASGTTTARGARNFQFVARKHEFGDGRAGRRADFIYARRASGDGESGSGKVSGRAGFTFSWKESDGHFSGGTPDV